ncbi:hypothetical protein KIN20_019580 [Parelaphostrongylus tenuis]|uniref:Uncharacterized protein n=1 Tax=Parelaphostrongylus tenuis TaxID=148309 RepID=A0AAD5QSH8_PARTN|nr:hypothetical protein KIN20_019580 [Parelaphostrongylus tenuis]
MEVSIYRSMLVSTLDGQSTPNYHTNKENSTTDSEDLQRSLSSNDTCYGLEKLIDSDAGERNLEAFVKPRPEDDKWVTLAHQYFDREKNVAVRHCNVRSNAVPVKGGIESFRLLLYHCWAKLPELLPESEIGIGRLLYAEYRARRYPLPADPPRFSLSKAYCELSLRPEKRYSVPRP